MPETPPHPQAPLLFLDYDGTLAPIVDDPAAAHPHPGVPDLLRALAARHPVWLVSGRDLAALGRFLPDQRIRAIGLHGVEEGRLGEPARRPALAPLADALTRLRAAVPEIAGVRVEEKSGAFAVHYRQAEDEATARVALERWAEGAPEGAEAVWGKKVVELRPRGVTKGTAVAAIAARHTERTPVYLGDDVTDEDAFQALHVARPDAVTVKVGDGETAARYRLEGVPAVVRYLRGFAGA